MFSGSNILQFSGASGQNYCFKRCSVESGWAQLKGVVVFAARDAMGWRAVDIVTIRNLEDLGPVWRWREARRYGAQAVFALSEANPVTAARIRADLEAGLRPMTLSSGFGAGLAQAA